MEKLDFDSVAMIGRDGMNAAPGIGFVDVVGLQSFKLRSLGQIDAIECELHRGGFNDGFAPIRNGVT